MESIQQWGLDFIQILHSRASPALTVFMSSIPWFGSAAACLLLISLSYWCIDEKKGFAMGIAVIVSAWLSITVKSVFEQSLPSFAPYDPSAQLSAFSSGHAQNVLVMWLIAASLIHKKWAYISAVALCLLISFSQMFLGILLLDILAGWALGGAVLCVYFLLGEKISVLLGRGGYRAQMLAIAAASFIMILYRPAEDFLIPGALLLGFGIGYIVNKRYVQFKSAVDSAFSPTVKYRIMAVRFLLGITGAVLLYVIFGKLTPIARGTSFYMLAFFSQYALMGLWLSTGAPKLFCLIRLAHTQTVESKGAESE